MMGTPDLLLFERWQRSRDAEAFHELVRRHAGMVYATCKRVLLNEHDAEEVAQECFARLVQGDVPPPKRSFGAWLHMFATNRAIDRLRHDSSRMAREHTYAETRPAARDIAWNDIREHVDEAIAALPDKVREAVVLHFLEGRTHQEIAELVNMPRPTVSRQIAGGVERVRRSLRRKGITLAAGLLMALLRANAAEAAPSTLVLELGKMAVAGGASVSVATVATAGAAGSGFLASLASMKTGLIAAGAVAAIAVGAVVLSHRPSVPTAAEPVSPAPVVESAAATPATPAAVEPQNEEAEASGKVADLLAAASEESRARERGMPGVLDLKMGADATITGTVLNADGSPAVDDHDCPLAHVILRLADKHASFEPGKGARFSVIHVRPGAEGYLWAASKDKSQVTQRMKVKVPAEGLQDVCLRLGPAGGVRGRVADRANNPLGKAHVLLTSRADGFQSTVTADEDGQFTFECVSPDQYLASATSAYNYGPVLGPLAIAVVGGQVSGGHILRFDGILSKIAGRVTDRNGTPLKDALVMISGSTHSRPMSGTLETDEQGRFSITLTEARSVNLQASKGGFVQSEVKQVDPGDTNTEFVLTPTGSISGRVIHAVTREPITRYTIQTMVVYQVEHGRGSTGTGWTGVEDAEGRFQSEIHAKGNAEIVVRVPGFYEAVKTIPNVSPEQPISDVLVELTPAEPLRGVVTDPQGQPVVGASLVPGDRQAFGRPQPGQDVLAMSDGAGRFALASPPTAGIEMTVFHEHFVPKLVPVPPMAQRPAELTIQLDPGATVSGVVRKGQEVLAGCKVGLMMHRPAHVERRTETDAEGRYAFRGLPEGDARLELSSNNGLSGNARVSVPATGSVTADIIIATGTAALEGAITLAGKVAAPGSVSVDYEDESANPRTVHARTDLEGHYRLEDLPPGDVSVCVFVEGEYSRCVRSRVRLVNAQTKRMDARFAAADASLEGQVDLGEWVTRAMNCSISVDTGSGTELVHLGDIDPKEGCYRFDRLPAGRAKLSVWASLDAAGEFKRTYEFGLASGRTTRQDIQAGNACILGTVSGGDLARVCVCIYEGDLEVPRYDELSMDDIERMPHVAAINVAGDGGYVSPPAEAGRYTVVAISFDVTGMTSEADILTSARWASQAVDVREGETARVDLSIP